MIYLSLIIFIKGIEMYKINQQISYSTLSIFIISYHTKSGKMEQFFNLGKSCVEGRKLNEALDCFGKIIRKNPAPHEYDLFFDAYIEMSQVYVKLKKYRDAEFYLQKALDKKEELRYEKCQEREKKSQIEYKIFPSFGYIYESQIDMIPPQNIKQISKLVDKSLNYCSASIDLSAKILIKYISNESIKDRIQTISEWSNYYANSIWNAINPLFIEVQKTQQKIIYQKIIQIIDKLSRFYELAEDKEAVKNSYSKGRFHRAVCLCKLTNYQDPTAEKLLKNDYKYCHKKRQQDSKNVTRLQLIKYYERREQFEEAKRYLEGKQQERNFRLLMAYFRQIEKIVSEIRSKQFIQRLDEESQIKKFQQLQEKVNEQKLWINKYWECVQQILKYIRSDRKQLLSKVCHEASQLLFNAYKYEKAMNLIKIAMDNCQKGSIQQYNIICHYTIVVEALGTENNQKIKDMYKKCQKMAARFVHQIEKDDFNKWYDEIVLRNQRNMKHKSYQIYSQREQSLFKLLERNKRLNQNSSQCEEVADQRSYMIDQASKGFGQKFIKATRNQKQMAVSKKQILQEKYRKFCTENPQVFQIRKFILEKIHKNADRISEQLEIDSIYNLQQPELFLLMQVFELKKWNFQNCQINKSSDFLEIIVKRSQIGAVTSFKYDKKIKNLQNLFNVLEKLKSLQILHLTNIIDDKKSSQIKITHINLQNPSNLRVLKLRSCQIEDNFLFNIRDFIHLNTLNLRNNNIKGEGLFYLKQLKWLNKLNISENPLQNGNFNIQDNKLSKFKVKNLKAIPEGSFKNIIMQSQIIDFSQNKTENVEKILRQLINFLLDSENDCSSLKEIKLKKMHISLQILNLLKEVALFVRNLKKIDLRFTNFFDEEESFENSFTDRGKNLTVLWKKYKE